MKHVSTLVLGLAACAPTRPAVAPPDSPAPLSASAPAGFYSVEQAARGEAAFQETCAECHGLSDFRGREFEWTWRRQTAWDLFRTIRRTMPEDNPSGLLPQTYADVVAYILQLNAYTAGPDRLTATEVALDAIPLGPGATKHALPARESS